MANEHKHDTPETDLWEGHPSQWMAFGFYLVCGLLALLLAGLTAWMVVATQNMGGYWYYPAIGVLAIVVTVAIRYQLVRSTHYRLTDQRLIVEEGIFSRDSEEIELYRVKDWSVIKPFWLRLANRGHIRVLSTDATAPNLVIKGITKPDRVRELIRKHVEFARDKKRVFHHDMEGTPYE